MIDKYNMFKLKYEKYVLIFKSGNFYVCLNKDALILNKLLKYRINEINNVLKIGFPISTINKVLGVLEQNNINYLIIDTEIVSNVKFKKNYYDMHVNEEYITLNYKINNIYKLLKANIDRPNIKQVINEIESIVWKINC